MNIEDGYYITYAGLFGYTSNADIRNVGVVGAQVTCFDACGLVGHACDSSITNCYATGTVSATKDKYSSEDLNATAGGVVGKASGGSITHSAALNQRVNTSGAKESYVGRVIGYYSEDTKLTYNYAWKGMQTNGEWTGDNGKSILDPWDNTGFVECTLKFDDNWIMGTRGDYRLPLLKWQPADSVPGDVTYLRS